MSRSIHVAAGYVSLAVQSVLMAAMGGSLVYALLVPPERDAIFYYMLSLFGIGVWQMADALIGAGSGSVWRKYHFVLGLLYLFVASWVSNSTPNYIYDFVPRDVPMTMSLYIMPFFIAVGFWFLSFQEAVQGKTIIE